jgi:hypothetical protein
MYDSKNSFTEVLSTGVIEQDLGGGGDVASTNSINLDKAGIAFAGGKGQYLIVRCVETFATGDGATSLDIKLESDTATGFATALKDVATYNILLATMTAGTLLVNQQVPVQEYQQFIRLYFNAIGGTWTAGKLVAYLQDHPETAEAQIDLVDVA